LYPQHFPEYPFSSHFATIDGHRLHYLDEGTGPVIVMVHGNPTWSYYYRHLVTLLSRTNRVIAVDHLGCGLSDKPQNYPYQLKNHIDNLQALLTQLQITSYSMIVHDWGGAIGLGVAGKTPQALEKLVILNTAAFRSQRIPWRIQLCRWPFIGKLLVRGLNGFAGPAVFMAVTRRLRPEVAQAYLAPYDCWDNRVAVDGFVRDIPLNSTHPSYETLARVEEGLQALADRDIPVLVCWGGRDFCFNDHFYHEWQRRFPHAQCHYFKEAGHYVLEDALPVIRPLLEDFFAGVSGSSAKSDQPAG
jgi:cis-3-alkyl-4-acyloxetan-2-one decarboxylase